MTRSQLAAMLIKQDAGECSMSSGDDLRRHCIAEAAYFKAEKRGFAPGFEEQDWAEAEMEFDAACKQMEHSSKSLSLVGGMQA